MTTLAVPIDGRITSQNTLSVTSYGALVGTEVMEIVAPGNATLGNTYQITLATLGLFFSAFPVRNNTIITGGATAIVPYDVKTTETRVLFDKDVSSASYAVCPLASTMVYGQPVLFKDLKGDAETNLITVTFTGGELCDGLSTVQITGNYGWVTIAPTPGGGSWYMC